MIPCRRGKVSAIRAWQKAVNGVFGFVLTEDFTGWSWVVAYDFPCSTSASSGTAW